MHAGGIYEIRNTVNGKRYVGSAKTFGNRWRVHVQSLRRGDHHSRALQRAWEKYTPAAFQFNKLLICSEENLILYEQAAIDAFKPEYNCAPRAGSQAGFKFSEHSRAKMAEAARKTRNFTGRRHSDFSKAKISASRKGKGGGPMTEDRRAKIGAAHKGRVISKEHRAKISATLTGHTQTAEQIEKRAQKLRGRKMPPGFSEATSARLKGSKLPPSHCENIGKSKAKLSDQQVRDIRTLRAQGRTRKSLAEQFDIDPASITHIVARTSYAWVKF